MKTHPLEPLSKTYLLQKDISSSTHKSYQYAFKHYITYLRENEITYAKTSDVIHYRQSRRSIGDSAHWIYIQISALKGLYRYLRIHQKRLELSDAYAYDVMRLIKNERIKHRIKKPMLSIKQAKHLILHTKASRTYLWHYRDHAIIILMMTSALRRFEIINAKIVDYQIKEESALLYLKRNHKNGNETFVKLSKGAREALDDYLSMRVDQNPYLFISHKQVSPKAHLSRTFFYEMFPRVLKSCGLDDLGITPNCLRHMTAFVNLLRGGSLEATRQLMRHVSIKSTLIYADHMQRLNDDAAYKIDAFILKEDKALSFDLFAYFFKSLDG